MYLDETAKEMVFNLSKVISDQKKQLEETENNLKMYKDWYNDSKKRELDLENRIKELYPPTPINMDVIESNGSNNIDI